MLSRRELTGPTFLFALACIVSAILTPVSIHAEDPILLTRGEEIYRATCAGCHGDNGQGVAGEYSDPLIGDASVGALTKTITETMPEEEPETCVAEDAAAVATYIHHAFYSPAAQLRNRPPQIQFARLTAEQLRQSIADLYGRFENQSWVVDGRGIKGTYFKGSRYKKENIAIDRVDPVLDFDFGDKGPGDGIDPQEFYVHWAGSLKVDHSGRYEIVLRSTCSCMMYFGDDRREFINNHVQSAGKEEFRRVLQLTAGRAYPIKLEFFQRKRKTKQPPAAVSLSWVPPGGVEEVIPTRHLIPEWLPDTFSLQAKLPPDDSSYGYSRGTSVDRQWDDSITNASLEFAQIAIDELYPSFRRKHRGEDSNRDKLRAFLTEVIETAFRGAIDDATRKLYIDLPLSKEADDGDAIRRVVLMTLKSPRFLYPSLDHDRSPSQRVANRLALVMFDSLPSDQWLVDAARKGHLVNDNQIGGAAQRMLKDCRTQAKMRSFLYHWFDLADVDEITKDEQAYPGFDQRLVSDLRASFDALLDEVVWSDSSDYRQLFLADWVYTNDRLAKFYGDKWKPAEEGNPADKLGNLRRSVGDAQSRIGAASHPLLMSKLAYQDTSSPIHRGVFLIRYALGRTLRPPNAAFTPIDPDLHPDLTTRQRVELQTGDENCQICHEKINALGFALENFDAAGRFRELERGQKIDAKGSYTTLDGKLESFDSPRQLAQFLAGSQDSHHAFVESMFEHFVKQPVAAYGSDTINRLTKQFRETGFNIQKLLVAIAVTASTHQPST